MRKVLAALLLAAAALPSRAGSWSKTAVHPAYHAVESLSDRVYGLLRGDLFTPLLPGRLSRKLSAVPVSDSYPAFTAELRRRQEHAARRDAETLPTGSAATPQAQDAWRRKALVAHTEAALDALAHTMLSRYHLEAFGRDSSDYAAQGANWDRELVTSGVLFVGAYTYLVGMRAGWNAGPAHIGLDLRPGSALRGAARSGTGSGLASLRISPRAGGLTLRTDWGLRGGHALAERIGLSYARRF